MKSGLKFRANVSTMLVCMFGIFSAVAFFFRRTGADSVLLTFQFAAVYILLSSYSRRINRKYLLETVLFSQLILILISLLFYPFRLYSFQGLFYNPNSLGGVASTTLSVLCCYSVDYPLRGRKKLIKLISRVILGFILFFALIISSSRASILIFLVIVLLIIALRINSRRFVYANVILLGVLSILLISNIDWINQILRISIIEKMERKGNDISSGRLEVWITALEEVGFWGRGRGYFAGLKNMAHSAHNTFVGIMAQNGYVAVAFYILFWASLVHAGIREYTSTKRLSLLLITVLFIGLSLFESMNGKLSMYLPFLLLFNVNNYRQGEYE